MFQAQEAEAKIRYEPPPCPACQGRKGEYCRLDAAVWAFLLLEQNSDSSFLQLSSAASSHSSQRQLLTRTWGSSITYLQHAQGGWVGTNSFPKSQAQSLGAYLALFIMMWNKLFFCIIDVDSRTHWAVPRLWVGRVYYLHQCKL